jgi:hypothetical protein
LCKKHNLPIISIPTTGYQNQVIELTWHHLKDKPNDIFAAIDANFDAEVIAAKMIHGDGKNLTYDYARARARKPERNLYHSSATWSFQNTRPDWNSIITPVITASPEYSAAQAAALADLKRGSLTFSYYN